MLRLILSFFLTLHFGSLMAYSPIKEVERLLDTFQLNDAGIKIKSSLSRVDFSSMPEEEQVRWLIACGRYYKENLSYYRARLCLNQADIMIILSKDEDINSFLPKTRFLQAELDIALNPFNTKLDHLEKDNTNSNDIFDAYYDLLKANYYSKKENYIKAEHLVEKALTTYLELLKNNQLNESTKLSLYFTELSIHPQKSAILFAFKLTELLKKCEQELLRINTATAKKDLLLIKSVLLQCRLVRYLDKLGIDYSPSEQQQWSYKPLGNSQGLIFNTDPINPDDYALYFDSINNTLREIDSLRKTIVHYPRTKYISTLTLANSASIAAAYLSKLANKYHFQLAYLTTSTDSDYTSKKKALSALTNQLGFFDSLSIASLNEGFTYCGVGIIGGEKAENLPSISYSLSVFNKVVKSPFFFSHFFKSKSTFLLKRGFEQARYYTNPLLNPNTYQYARNLKTDPLGVIVKPTTLQNYITQSVLVLHQLALKGSNNKDVYFYFKSNQDFFNAIADEYLTHIKLMATTTTFYHDDRFRNPSYDSLSAFICYLPYWMEKSHLLPKEINFLKNAQFSSAPNTTNFNEVVSSFKSRGDIPSFFLNLHLSNQADEAYAAIYDGRIIDSLIGKLTSPISNYLLYHQTSYNAISCLYTAAQLSINPMSIPYLESKKLVIDFETAIQANQRSAFIKSSLLLGELLLPRAIMGYKKLNVLPAYVYENLPFEALLSDKPKKKATNSWSSLPYLQNRIDFSYPLLISVKYPRSKTITKYSPTSSSLSISKSDYFTEELLYFRWVVDEEDFIEEVNAMLPYGNNELKQKLLSTTNYNSPFYWASFTD